MSQTYTPKRTSTADPVSGTILATIVSQQDATIFLPYGVQAINSLGQKPSPHRSGLSAIDTNTDCSTGSGFATGRLALNNDAAILAWGECTTSGSTITLAPIYFDNQGRPIFEGTSFTLASTGRQVQSGGNYMSRLHDPLANPGAGAIKLYVTAVAGTWNLYLASI